MSRRGPRGPVARATWAARITATVVSAVIVVTVLLPVLALIGAAQATSFGTLRIPIGAIAASITISYLLGLGLLVVAFRSRIGAVAWVAGVAAVIATLVGSLWPLFATAFASVSQIQDVVPFIQQLIGHVAAQN